MMQKNSTVNGHILCVMLGVTSWLLIYPYVFWGVKSILVVIGALLTLSYSAFLASNKFRVNRHDCYFVIYWLLTTLVLLHPGLTNGASIQGYILIALTASIYFIAPDELKLDAFLFFRLLFVLSLIPGMLVWLIHSIGLPIDYLILGEISGQEMLNPAKAESNNFYYKFPGSVVTAHHLDEPLFRLCGMFDEPGVVGTLSVLFLVADSVNLKKWQNLVMFIAGLMSLSMAFFILISLYFILRFSSFYKQILLICFVSIAIFFTLPEAMQDQLDVRVFNRLSISDMSLSGDNRGNAILEKKWQNWVDSAWTELLFGVSYQVYPDGSSSWKTLLITKGMVGLATLLGIICLLTYRYYHGWGSLVLLIIFCLSMYQRPFVWTLPSLMILTGGNIGLKSQPTSANTKVTKWRWI